MDWNQIKQTVDTNKVILKNTFVLVQMEKSLFEAPWLEAKKKFSNRYGKLYERFYEDGEISTDHIMDLYKTAGQI